MLLIALAAVFFSQPTIARQLSPQEAYNYAIHGNTTAPESKLMGMMSTMSAQTEPELVHTVTTDDVPTVYVYQRQRGGFYIVAANDAVPSGLLAFADKGEFDTDEIPQNVAMWLSHYGQQVAYAATQEYQETVSDSTTEHDCGEKRHCIQPLVFTRWGQTAPYNLMCPEINGKRTVTGCVATAMAQVMASNRWPDTGIGSVSYKTSGVQLTQDFSEINFDWEAICDGKLKYPQSDAAKNAVAQLIQACGYSVKMSYGPSASGATLLAASRALVNNFNYDKGLAILGRDYFDDVTWDEIIYNEIKEGRAVIYSGVSNVSGGHAFVCDGYDCSGYFHFNWGWDGAYDGYFALTALDPYHNNNGFDYNENVIIGIRPAIEGSETRPVIQFSGALSMSATSTTVTVKCDNGIFNQGTAKVTLNLGAKLDNVATGETRYIENNVTKSLVVGQAVKSYTMPRANFPTEGTWVFTPAIKTEEGVWYDVLIKRSVEYAYVMEVHGDQMTLTPASEAFIAPQSNAPALEVEELALGSRMTYNSDYEVVATITNVTNRQYQGEVFPVLFSGDDCVAWGTSLEVTLQAGQSETFSWDSTWDAEVAPGTYRMALADENEELLCEGIEVMITTSMMRKAAIDQVEVDEEIIFTEVYNMSGQLVLTYENTQQVQVKAGVYVLRHHLADGSVRNEKVMMR